VSPTINEVILFPECRNRTCASCQGPGAAFAEPETRGRETRDRRDRDRDKERRRSGRERERERERRDRESCVGRTPFVELAKVAADGEHGSPHRDSHRVEDTGALGRGKGGGGRGERQVGATEEKGKGRETESRVRRG